MATHHAALASLGATLLIGSIAMACSVSTVSMSPAPSPAGGRAPSGQVSLPPASGSVPDAIPADVIAAVMEAAATAMDSASDEVGVISAEARTWSDGSLGCPEPGVFYTQALVDGYQVVVEVGGERLDYRIGQGEPRLCAGFAPGGSDGG
jgi:hypothetical protein